MTTFYLIRHADTGVQDLINGRRPGVWLSSHGREQAQQLQERLSDADLKAIFCSPMERARETAQFLANKRLLSPECLDNLTEVDFGLWTGSPISGLAADETWKRFHQYRSGTRIPGGESMLEIQTRMVSAFETIQARHPDDAVAVVSHADPLRALICFCAGMPIDFLLRLHVDLASYSIVKAYPWSAEIVCLNVTH